MLDRGGNTNMNLAPGGPTSSAMYGGYPVGSLNNMLNPRGGSDMFSEAVRIFDCYFNSDHYITINSNSTDI
jgi:hypothetical protein